jgi:serpin B
MKRRRLLTGTAALGAAWALGPLAAACGSSNKAKASEVRADLPRDTPGADGAAQAKRLGDAVAAFGWDMLGQLTTPSATNLFLSPYSISVAMAMVLAGARGESADELSKALHLQGLGADTPAAFNAANQVLAAAAASQKDQQPFELAEANALWAQAGFEIQKAYLETLARFYGAGVRLVDYEHAAEDARKAINDWVADQTKKRIQDLLPKGSVNDMTRLVLANAIYFKADWTVPFEPKSTSPAPFTLRDGSRKDVPTMTRSGSFLYAERADGQMIELPYAGGSTSMLVLLPKAGAFAAVEQDAANAMTVLTAQLKSTQVRLSMPKWEFTSSFALKDAFAALGAKAAFDPDRADLSGIDGRRDLYISDVFHKAFVKVDEKGTEAAAATGAVVGVTSAPLPPPIEFKMDRPFLFVIREKTTGLALFAGRVVDPSA